MSASRGSDLARGLIQRRLHLHQALLRIGDPLAARPISLLFSIPFIRPGSDGEH
jgi:hypothetical protein